MIPKRLEEDLNNAPKFKPGMPPRKTVADLMTDSVESAMYDEMFGSIVNRRSTDMTPKLSAALNSNAMSSDRPKPSSDLTVSLLARLTDCESELKLNRRQLAEKLRRVTELEDENRELKRQLQAPDEVYEELEFVKGQNEDLIHKLQEMEQFLSDYGLVWVGNNSNPSADSITNESKDDVGRGVNYNIFAKKVDELNQMIHSEPTQIQTDDKGRKARLVRASEMLEQIRIVFFKDGLMVKRGPFRDNGSDSYKSFTRDIMDGYFPSEFKLDYPDGVVFNLVDKHDQKYDPQSFETNAEGKMTSAQLLQRLPKTVIRNGEIIDIRDSIQSKLNPTGSSGNTKLAYSEDKLDAAIAKSNPTQSSASLLLSKSDQNENSNVVGPVPTTASAVTVAPAKKKEQKTLISTGFENGESSPVTVQVRWIDGTVLVVKMVESENIGILRQLIVDEVVIPKAQMCTTAAAANNGSKDESSVAASSPLQPFELRSVWPARKIEDDSSLRDAGLVPSGTLHAFKL